MRSLFDVNFLIALFTPSHVHAHRAHAWWQENGAFGWASCPLTQNGFVRITSQPAFPHASTTLNTLDKLRQAIAGTSHEFWADELSIMDENVFDTRFILGHRQVTDTYLLALAVRNKGRLVTLDRSIQLAAVKEARPDNLLTV